MYFIEEILANRKYRDLQESPYNRRVAEQSPVNLSNISSSSQKMPTLFLEKQEVFKKVKQHFINEREKILKEMYSEDFFDIIKKKKEGYLKMKQGLQERFHISRSNNSPSKKGITEVGQQNNNEDTEDILDIVKKQNTYQTPKKNSKVIFSPDLSPIKEMNASKSSSLIKQNFKIDSKLLTPLNVSNKLNEEQIDLNSIQISESKLMIPKSRLQIINQDTLSIRKQSLQRINNQAS